MIDDTRARRAASVVMLTADRQIDRRILLEADSLEQAGWTVTIIGMALDDGIPDEDPRIVRIGRGPLSPIRESFVLNAYRLVRRALPMNSRLMRDLKSLAWQYFVDQEGFYMKLFLDTALRYRPDVFMAHDLPMLPVAYVAAQRTNAKLAYDSHELYSEQEFPDREKRRWAKIEAKHIRFCDLVTTVNQSIATELERRYSIRDVQVVYNAERSIGDPGRIKLLHKTLELAPGKKLLLLQGGLSGGRNLEVLVDAMHYVQSPDVDLVILGDGLLKQSLERKAHSNGSPSRVHFHPAVSQQQLLEFTAAADAGVIPYQATCLNNYYCTPNKLFEFIAAGVPILGSDLPEIRKLVTGNRIGLVGDMSTAESSAKLIDAFFGDIARLENWRQNVLEVRKSVCWEKEGKKLVGAFEPFRS